MIKDSDSDSVEMNPELRGKLDQVLQEKGLSFTEWVTNQAERYLARDEFDREDYLRAIVETTPECIKVLDEDGTILQMNPAGLEMVAADKERICGTSVYNLIAPEFHAEFRKFNRDICNGKRGGIEFDILSKNGHRRHMESNGAPLAGPDGTTANLSITRDVTARKKAEEVHRKTAESLATLVTQSPLGIYVVDSQFRISMVSAGSEPAFRNVQPVVGRDFEEVMHTLWPASFAEEVIEIFRHTLETGEPYASPGLTRKRKDIDEVESYEWQLIRVTLADGQYGAVCYYFDSTRLQSARIALEESEERFRMLADNMSQLAWTCERLGEVNWYNERWLDYTGLSFEQLRDWGWKKVHHPDHVDRVVERIQASRDSGEIWEDTFPLLGKDGRYRWFLSRAVPIKDETGSIIRWFGTNTDVTELRESQQLLREGDRRKDEFLATLAHELRNPLAPIRTGLEVMKMAKDNPRTIEKVRNTLERQTEQMISLVDDLLNMSRITRGKLELRRERIDLVGVIERAVEASRCAIEEAGHQLTVSLPKEDVFLDADPSRMAQIFSNLLNNSAKYTPNGGAIQLSAELTEEDSVMISVKDNGLGIPEAMFDSIFDMFSQIKRPDKTHQGGLGIGLSLVKKLVEMHGGKIAVQSDGINQGSVFTVSLPVTNLTPESCVASDEESENDDTSLSHLKVLVVDDNEEAADMLELHFDMMGSAVRKAGNGREAITMAADFQPDVILMDLGMPEMDGLEATREIRKLPCGESIFIVALTGWGLEKDRQKTDEAGFDHHLVKPVRPSALRELLLSVDRKMPV